MIAKINTGSNLYGALAYNQEKVDEGMGKVLATNLVCEPIDGHFSVQGCAADFARWMTSPEHLPTKKPVIHISLGAFFSKISYKGTSSEIVTQEKTYKELIIKNLKEFIIFKRDSSENINLNIRLLARVFEERIPVRDEAG